ncbi:hypothetical protein N7512_003885 [Penicillium capsulatum]|nr:hypothetical protein N7512_003885 [Penicillium capsulatum]
MPEQQGLLTDPDDDDSSDWTYGQVVSVVLLVAPFITMIGYFNDDDAPERKDAIAARASPSNLLLIPLESSSLSTEPIYSNESVYDPDHPERGWMYRKATLVDASVYSMLTLTWNAYFLLFASLHSSTPTPLYAFIIWGPVAVNFLKNFALGLTGLYGVIVFSLMIETTLARWDRVYRIVLHFLIIAYFILSFSSVFFSPAASSFLQPMAGVCYIVSALVYRLVGSSE